MLGCDGQLICLISEWLEKAVIKRNILIKVSNILIYTVRYRSRKPLVTFGESTSSETYKERRKEEREEGRKKESKEEIKLGRGRFWGRKKEKAP